MYVADEKDVIQAIDRGQVKAGVVIPPGLAGNIARNEAQVLLILDGSDSFTVQSGYSAAVKIAQAHATDLMIEQISRTGAGLGLSASESSDMLPISTSTRVLYNPDLDDMTFVVPGLAAMLLQTLATGQAAIGIVRERELGTMEQLLVTPIRPIELVVGKMIPRILLTFVDMLIIILLGIFWFGVPFNGNPWLFAWLALLFIIAGLGLGLLISTVSKSQRQAQQLTVVLMMLSMLLTGFIYPLAPMPIGVRIVGNLIPLTYFIRITRGIITKGVDLTFLWSDVIALIFYALMVMLSAAVTFKKRLD
jgi:ABC-2 type transport system permease protein